jgi:hypothetical protein
MFALTSTFLASQTLHTDGGGPLTGHIPGAGRVARAHQKGRQP